MIRNKTHVICSILLVFFVMPVIQASIILKGDKDAPVDATLSFPVYAHTAIPTSENMYLGACNAGTAKEYALSYIARNNTVVLPIAAEKVTLNGVEDVTNPCFNASFSFLEVLGASNKLGAGLVDRLVAVTKEHPANIYLIDNHTNFLKTIMFSLEGVKDATGRIAGGIVGLASTLGGRSGVFAAVKKAGGEFGDPGSGIALVQLSEMLESDIEKITKAYAEAAEALRSGKKPAVKIADPAPTVSAPVQTPKKGDAPNATKIVGKKEVEIVPVPVAQEGKRRMIFGQLDARQEGEWRLPRAVPLDKTSEVVAIQNHAASMGKAVALHWDAQLQCLYIGLHVQAGSQSGDGVKAIVVGTVDEHTKMTLKPFAPHGIFTQDAHREIIGTCAPGKSVTVHTLKTMQTSTGLFYLIVLGGNDDSKDTASTLYALPIVNGSDGHGTLASLHNEPKKQFTEGGKRSVYHRTVVDSAAVHPEDIFTTECMADGSPTINNYPAHIGFGKLKAGPIAQIIVSGDAVFAVVRDAAPGQLPGIFHSQALFDERGMIKAWTQWQRVAGECEAVCGASYDHTLGNFTLMMGNQEGSTVIKRTSWGSGDAQKSQPLTAMIAKEFPVKSGGVQGFFDIKCGTPGIGDSSLMIATGFGKVALIQTGVCVDDVCVPYAGVNFEQSVHYAFQGSLTTNVQSPMVVLSGGQLAAIGPVGSAEIACASDQGLLFVGGSKGVAVLHTADGRGWDASCGVGKDFTHLPVGMTFKKVGDYKDVRSLVHDGNYLYVLTSTRLDRLDLTKEGYPAMTVATVAELPNHTARDRLTTCIVSDKFALLGTTLGLLRVGNGNDIRHASKTADVEWTSVAIAESSYPVVQLCALSSTGRATDIARYNGGNIYVLTAHHNRGPAHVNRFVIKPTERIGVSIDTVMPIADIYFKDMPTAFIQFGDYRSFFSTDGTLLLHMANRNINEDPFLKAGYVKRHSASVPLPFTNASTLLGVTRNSALGNWVVAGDNGLFVNE